jgi:hypothetical protein
VGRIHEAAEDEFGRDAVIVRQGDVIVAFEAGVDAEFALECVKRRDGDGDAA